MDNNKSTNDTEAQSMFNPLSTVDERIFNFTKIPHNFFEFSYCDG